MNEQLIAQLRSQQADAAAALDAAAAAYHVARVRLAEIDQQIRGAYVADSAALVVERMEAQRAAVFQAQLAEQAANAANNAAWLQLQANGETDEARRERERFQQNRIDAEAERERREELNRRRRLAALNR